MTTKCFTRPKHDFICLGWVDQWLGTTLYGVAFVDSVSDWYSASVSVIINEISYNIGLHHHSTRLYFNENDW